MPYLKSSQITGLSPKPLDVTGFTQSDTEILDGTYSQHEVLLADNYNIKGDVTISDNLILAKLSDDGNAITLTGDSTTRTISGSGSLEGSTFAQTPNASMTGMTGNPTLGSTTIFPVGHVIQVVQKTDTDNATVAGATVGPEAYSNVLFDNLNFSITPHKNTSKILVTVCVSISATNANGTGHVRLVRDPTGTVVPLAIGPADGSSVAATFSMRSASEHAMHHQAMTYLDSPTIPSTPVAIWYGLQGFRRPSGYAMGYNMPENTTTGDPNMGRHMSTLTLMEIAQ